jgi:hypothetical protein
MLAALKHGDLVHIVTLHRAPGTSDVYAIHCGGYTTSAVFGESSFATCVVCASGRNYWYEELG